MTLFDKQLESIREFHPKGENMTPSDVAKYLGRSDRRQVVKDFPFRNSGTGMRNRWTITRTVLAYALCKGAEE